MKIDATIAKMEVKKKKRSRRAVKGTRGFMSNDFLS